MFAMIKRVFSPSNRKVQTASHPKAIVKPKQDYPSYSSKVFAVAEYDYIKELIKTLQPIYISAENRHNTIITLLQNTNLENSVSAFNTIKEQLLANIEATSLVLSSFNESFPIATHSDNSERLELTESVLKKYAGKVNSTDLKILIVGQFKQGKSTLVNALLGEQVLPAYSTPCTAVITELKYGEKKSAKLYFKKNLGKLPENLPTNIVQHLASHDPKNVPPLEIDVYDLESCLVIPDPGKEQEKSVAESPYDKCEVFWPLELCKNGVLIIDSPGLNEAEAREKTTLNYIDQVDMIIHVMNCQQLAGKYDKDFITTAKNYGFENLIFACNRFDQLNTDKDRVRVQEYAYKKLENQTSLGRNGIFFISSYPALNAKIHNDLQEYEKSGFADFEAGIGELVINDRAKIKILPTLLFFSNEIGRLISERIDPLEKLLDKNALEIQQRYDNQLPKINELEKQLSDIRSHLKRKSAEINQRATAWIGSYVDEYIMRIPSIVSSAPIDIEILMLQPNEMNSILNQHLLSDLNKTTAQWINTTLIPRLKTETDIFQREIISHLQVISREVISLNSDLSVSVTKATAPVPMNSLLRQNVIKETSNKDIAVVGGLGGIGAYGIAALLATVTGGTAPLMIGVIAAIACGGLHAQKKLQKIKNDFTVIMQNQMKQGRDDFIRAIAGSCSSAFSEKVVTSIDDTEKSLLSTKRNLEAALILTKNKGEQNKKKQYELK
ncbi:MAG: dynamin family protein, partial [Desulfovibrionaceae bacterium]|nr:dynamin family protein [Desulfovibrionaceae bacterium]